MTEEVNFSIIAMELTDYTTEELKAELDRRKQREHQPYAVEIVSIVLKKKSHGTPITFAPSEHTERQSLAIIA